MLWQDQNNPYTPLGRTHPDSTTISYYNNDRINIDPFIVFYSNPKTKHSLRSRYYWTSNKNDTDQGSVAQSLYSEYQFQKHISETLTLTTGVVGYFNDVQSDLYGNHDGANFAAFAQSEKKLGRLGISLGLRAEHFRIDTFSTSSSYSVKLGENKRNLPIAPVFRAGLTYKLAEATVLRTSFGQGYRFPSIAEKYVQTTVDALNLFPNSKLQAEKGWSSELGVRQDIEIGSWKGIFDVAGFLSHYTDMTEFVFGLYNFDTIPMPLATFPTFIGFQAQNVEQANIAGIDLSISAQGKIFGLTSTVFAGYTYINPTARMPDSTYLANQSNPESGILIVPK